MPQVSAKQAYDAYKKKGGKKPFSEFRKTYMDVKSKQFSRPHAEAKIDRLKKKGPTVKQKQKAATKKRKM